MNKILILSFFFYTVSALRSEKQREKVISKHVESMRESKNLNGGKPFNLRENIKYQRQNNYELYINATGQLQQQRFGVNEPRQVLKKNVPDFRYLVNDLEVLTGVYTFNPRDKEKVLRETLKPESLCFMIIGYLTSNLNKINIDNSPLYGLLIRGQRNSNSVSDALEINAILSNVTVPLGIFEFPVVKNFPYQIPFLIGHYDSRGGYKNKSFSYICSLPIFLIDVMYTTKNGLKFNFNGRELDVTELFPITMTYSLENNIGTPSQKEDANKEEKEKLLSVLKKEAKDVPFRLVKSTGAEGRGIYNPSERLLSSKLFLNSRNQIRDFLSSSGKSRMDNASRALYFLFLSQKLFTKKGPSDYGRIAHVKVTNVEKTKVGYLSRYTLEVGLENSRWVSVTGTVQGKNIPLPADLTSSQVITLDIPFSHKLSLGRNGITYGFCDLEFPLSKALAYNINNLATFVR